jgi:hypothetical protein
MKLGTKIAIGLAATLVPAGATIIAQGAFTITGESYGVSVQTTTASLPKSPHVTLTWAGAESGDTTGLNVAALVSVDNLTTHSSGAGDPGDAGSQSSASTERLNLLGGLITADGVASYSSSNIKSGAAVSTADGSLFYNLVVNGVPISASVAPNTVISLPGVGSVTLNEQIGSGDGVNSTGLTVNMIHVHLTGLAQSGDIIVASANSQLTQ